MSLGASDDPYLGIAGFPRLNGQNRRWIGMKFAWLRVMWIGDTSQFLPGGSTGIH